MNTVNRGRPATCLLLTSVAFFMVALDALVVVTALPAIHRSVGGSLATLEWAVNAYGLTFAVGMITAALSARALPESRGGSGPAGRLDLPAGRLDLPAVPLVAGGAVALAWGLVRAGDAGWTDRWVIGALACGLALLAGFVLRERRAEAPMLPLGLFRIRAFAAANASGFLMSGAIFSAAFLTSQYFQLGLGYGPLATGLRLLPWTATPMLVAPLSGAVADRIGTRPLMAAGLALQAGGLGWVAWLASASGGYGRFVLPMIIAGVGISMALPTVATAALGAVAPPDMGRASGVNNTLQRFGGAFGIAVAAAVFSAHGQLGSPAGVTAGFRPALAVSALLSLLGAVAAVLAGRRGGARAPAAEAAVPA